MPEVLEAALEYARLGWPVVPLRPDGKVPVTPHGYKDGRTNAADIYEWWTEMYPGANVGIVCGAPGPDVLDFDKGSEDAERKCWDAGILGQAFAVVRTRSGGHHYYYAGSGQRGSKAAAKVDWRGPGYYVVAPPSRVGGLPYTWERRGGTVVGVSLARVQALLGAAKPERIRSTVDPKWRPGDQMTAADAVTLLRRRLTGLSEWDGPRHDAFLYAAYAIAQAGEEAFGMLEDLWNEHMERDGRPVPIEELRRMCLAPVKAPDRKKEETPVNGYTSTPLSEYKPEPLDPLYEVDGQPFVLRGEVNMLAGREAEGKSWFAQLAMREEIRRGGRVLLISEGSKRGLLKRFIPNGFDMSRIEIINQGPDCLPLTVEYYKQLADFVKSKGITLLVFDVLAEWSEGANLNDYAQVRTVVKRIQTILETDPGRITAIVVHHWNKMSGTEVRNRISGSQAFNSFRLSLAAVKEEMDDCKVFYISVVKAADMDVSSPYPTVAVRLDSSEHPAFPGEGVGVMTVLGLTDRDVPTVLMEQEAPPPDNMSEITDKIREILVIGLQNDVLVPTDELVKEVKAVWPLANRKTIGPYVKLAGGELTKGHRTRGWKFAAQP